MSLYTNTILVQKYADFQKICLNIREFEHGLTLKLNSGKDPAQNSIPEIFSFLAMDG